MFYKSSVYTLRVGSQPSRNIVSFKIISVLILRKNQIENLKQIERKEGKEGGVERWREAGRERKKN